MRTFGLIGYPLTHSFSQKYFTEKFIKENITNSEYKLFPIEKIGDLSEILKNNKNIRGLNVTIPYKEQVLKMLDEVEETAQKVGAVNCIKVIKTGTNPKLIGYNTDVFGFRQSIKPFLESHHEKALILGTGGGAKAVSHVLNELGIQCYFATTDEAKKDDDTFLYYDINENVIETCKLIVNTTPLGMYPNNDSLPDIPYESIESKHLLYDLIYNPAETKFLQQGRLKGANTVNGLSMLHQQAEKAWEIWNS